MGKIKRFNEMSDNSSDENLSTRENIIGFLKQAYDSVYGKELSDDVFNFYEGDLLLDKMKEWIIFCPRIANAYHLNKDTKIKDDDFIW